MRLRLRWAYLAALQAHVVVLVMPGDADVVPPLLPVVCFVSLDSLDVKQSLLILDASASWTMSSCWGLEGLFW